MIMRERGRPLHDGKRGAEIAELAEASAAKRRCDGSAVGEFSAEKGPKALFDDDALCAVRAEIFAEICAEICAWESGREMRANFSRIISNIPEIPSRFRRDSVEIAISARRSSVSSRHISSPTLSLSPRAPPPPAPALLVAVAARVAAARAGMWPVGASCQRFGSRTQSRHG